MWKKNGGGNKVGGKQGVGGMGGLGDSTASLTHALTTTSISILCSATTGQLPAPVEIPSPQPSYTAPWEYHSSCAGLRPNRSILCKLLISSCSPNVTICPWLRLQKAIFPPSEQATSVPTCATCEHVVGCSTDKRRPIPDGGSFCPRKDLSKASGADCQPFEAPYPHSLWRNFPS